MLSLGRRLSQRRLRSLFPFFSSSSSSASSSGRFDGQKVLLNRQTARPVLFDELESDDDLDFSLSEKPTGEGALPLTHSLTHSVCTHLLSR
jgi:hypothetical protein